MGAIDDRLAGLFQDMGSNITIDRTTNEAPQRGFQGTPATGTSFFPGSFIGIGPSVGSGGFGGTFNRIMGEMAGQRSAGQFGQRQAATLEPILQTLMQAMGFAGGGQGGGDFGGMRENLLQPRLDDIMEMLTKGQGQVKETATSQGRNVSASPFQKAMATLFGGAQKERQRATGDVDLLLAQLGQNQQSMMMQLLGQILGGFGGKLS